MHLFPAGRVALGSILVASMLPFVGTLQCAGIDFVSLRVTLLPRSRRSAGSGVDLCRYIAQAPVANHLICSRRFPWVLRARGGVGLVSDEEQSRELTDGGDERSWSAVEAEIDEEGRRLACELEMEQRDQQKALSEELDANLDVDPDVYIQEAKQRNRTTEEERVNIYGDEREIAQLFKGLKEGRLPPLPSESSDNDDDDDLEIIAEVPQMMETDSFPGWLAMEEEGGDCEGHEEEDAYDFENPLITEKSPGGAGLMEEGCSSLLASVQKGEIQVGATEFFEENDVEVWSLPMLLLANISDTCTAEHLEARLSGLEGLVSVDIISSEEVDPRARRLLAEERKNRGVEARLRAEDKAVDKADLEDKKGEERTIEWMSRLGIEAPEDAVALYSRDDDSKLAVWIAQLGRAGGRYALFTFRTLLSRRMALNKFDWKGLGLANSRCKKAWSEGQYFEYLLSLCRCREDVSYLLSRQLEQGLKALSGEECGAVLRRLEALRPTKNQQANGTRPEKQSRFLRNLPRMPPLLDPQYQPHNVALTRQHALVAELLLRVCKLSSSMRLRSLAGVLRVVTRMEKTGLSLPAGIDIRKYEIKGKDHPGDIIAPGPPTYGYPGLTTNVFLKLSTMRNGAVIEEMNGCPQDEIPEDQLEQRLSRCQKISRGDCSINPYVPHTAYKGDWHVKGAYTARSGSGANLRMWAGYGERRASLSEKALRGNAKRKDRKIDRLEEKYFRKHIRKEYLCMTDEEVDQCIAEKELMTYTKSMVYDKGSVRKPLEVCRYPKPPEPVDPYLYPSSDPDDPAEWEKIPPEMHAQVAAQGSYEGMIDPLYGRWQTHDLPPWIQEDMFPHNMPKTTEAHERQNHQCRARGEPYVDCVGGLKVPNNRTAQHLLKQEGLCDKKKDTKFQGWCWQDRDEWSDEELWKREEEAAEERRAKGREVGAAMLKASNHSASASLRRLLPFMGRMHHPRSVIFKEGFEREETIVDDPMRLRGFGGGWILRRGSYLVVPECALGRHPIVRQSCCWRDPERTLGSHSTVGPCRLWGAEPCQIVLGISGQVRHDTLRLRGGQKASRSEIFLDGRENIDPRHGDSLQGAESESVVHSHSEVEGVREDQLGLNQPDDSPLSKFFLTSQQWNEKLGSVTRRLLDPDGPLYNGTSDEKQQLADDIADQFAGCTPEEFAVLRAVCDKARAKEDGREGYGDDDALEMLEGALDDYPNLDRDIDENDVKQLILNEKLMRATDAGDCVEVERLIRGGAQVDFVDHEFEGCSPLHHAAIHDDFEMVQTLLRLGASVSVLDQIRCTPLHYAAREGSEEMIRKLVVAGADIMALDDEGRAPMHMCAGHGHSECLRLLLHLGAKVNHRNEWGDSALGAAASFGHADACRVLIKAGADVNVTNKMRMQPIDFVVEHNFTETRSVLEDAGARLRDPNITETWEEFWQEFRRLQIERGDKEIFNHTRSLEGARKAFDAYEQLKNGKGRTAEFIKFIEEAKPWDDELDEHEAEQELTKLEEHKQKQEEAKQMPMKKKARSRSGRGLTADRGVSAVAMGSDDENGDSDRPEWAGSGGDADMQADSRFDMV